MIFLIVLCTYYILFNLISIRRRKYQVLDWIKCQQLVPVGVQTGVCERLRAPWSFRYFPIAICLFEIPRVLWMKETSQTMTLTSWMSTETMTIMQAMKVYITQNFTLSQPYFDGQPLCFDYWYFLKPPSLCFCIQIIQLNQIM